MLASLGLALPFCCCCPFGDMVSIDMVRIRWVAVGESDRRRRIRNVANDGTAGLLKKQLCSSDYILDNSDEDVASVLLARPSQSPVRRAKQGTGDSS
jgi:hypothetical protein